MNTIAHFLFPAPAQRAPVAIFKWWESRRLGYNAIMGVTGVFGLGVMSAMATLPPGDGTLPPFALVAVYAVMANVFYSLGPIAEYMLEMLWPGRLLPTGPALFRMGLTFSLGLNFLGVAVSAWDWLIRVVTWLV